MCVVDLASLPNLHCCHLYQDLTIPRSSGVGDRFHGENILLRALTPCYVPMGEAGYAEHVLILMSSMQIAALSTPRGEGEAFQDSLVGPSLG